MVRNRLLVLLGAGFLSATGAWADGVAYVDCATHPEETQVFAKPRRTPDTVAAIPCGERFTLLLNGFIFSRVQTRDGHVGYVYSSVISMDRSGGAVPPPTATRLSGSASAPAATPKPAESNPAAAPAPVQQPAARPADAAANSASTAAPNAQPAPAAAAAQTQAPAASTAVPEVTAASAQGQATAAASSSPSREQLEAMAAASLNATAQPETTATAPAATAQPEATTATAPEAAPAAQPEPAPAEPAPAIRNVSMKESWEKPNPVARTVGVRNVGMPRLPLIELFGGYGYARLNNGAGYLTNSNGVLGSFGWNVKPWLQLIADSSYNRVTVSGTKNVLYGNHWGVRYFHRLRHSWGAAPFVEGMIGGSRADTTVSGTGGYSTSDIGMSYKVGGGLDIHPLRHFEIRVIDFDYYRTSFGTNLHQNNYFVSTGIVMRLFGRSEE